MEPILLVESSEIASPVSVVHYEYYKSYNHLDQLLKPYLEQIQCIVCHQDIFFHCIRPGQTQVPGLSEYADGIDTMEFLLRLK